MYHSEYYIEFHVFVINLKESGHDLRCRHPLAIEEHDSYAYAKTSIISCTCSHSL